MNMFKNVPRHQRTPVRTKFAKRDERLAATLWPVLVKHAAGPLESLRALHLLSVAILRSCREGPESEWEFVRVSHLETLRDLPVPYRTTETGLTRLEGTSATVVEPLALVSDAEPPASDDVWTWAQRRQP